MINKILGNNKSIMIFSIPRSGTHLTMQYLRQCGYTEFHADVMKNGLNNYFNT